MPRLLHKYGLIGASLKHSFSENYFSAKFRQENISAIYNNYELSEINQLSQLIASTPDLKGLNVTIPYKQTVIPFLDKLDAIADEIHAVNTIRINRDNEIVLEGFNTDAPAFEETLKPLLKSNHKKALVLGTGGAAATVFHVLQKLNITPVFVSRNKTGNNIHYNDITNDVIDEFHLIVNCSPVGMFPSVNSFPEIPYARLTSHHLVYDLIYNPETTLFLQNAAEQGAAIKNGMEMLYLQAELAWKIWNDTSN